MKRSFLAPGAKLLMLTFATAAMISCNNNSGDKKTTTDTSKTVVDNTHTMPVDTTAVPMVSDAQAILSGTYADTTVEGTAKFHVGADGKVTMILELKIPAKGGKSVAVHLHEHGDCGDTAKMAHGHWNPTNAQHGKWGSSSFHSGDIGNVKLDAKGKGTLTLTTDLWTLGGKPDKNILGRSVIIHGGMDDYVTQPSGNSGPRIGCGVIK